MRLRGLCSASPVPGRGDVFFGGVVVVGGWFIEHPVFQLIRRAFGFRIINVQAVLDVRKHRLIFRNRDFSSFFVVIVGVRTSQHVRFIKHHGNVLQHAGDGSLDRDPGR